MNRCHGGFTPAPRLRMPSRPNDISPKSEIGAQHDMTKLTLMVDAPTGYAVILDS